MAYGGIKGTALSSWITLLLALGVTVGGAPCPSCALFEDHACTHEFTFIASDRVLRTLALLFSGGRIEFTGIDIVESLGRTYFKAILSSPGIVLTRFELETITLGDSRGTVFRRLFALAVVVSVLCIIGTGQYFGHAQDGTVFGAVLGLPFSAVAVVHV